LKKFFQVLSESGSKSFEHARSESGSAFIVCPGWRLPVFPNFHNIKFFGSGLDFIGSTDPDPDWESGLDLGTGRPKWGPGKEKKIMNFHVEESERPLLMYMETYHIWRLKNFQLSIFYNFCPNKSWSGFQ
jgi:hypothetical protein